MPLPLLRARLMVNATSLAVIGLPSENFTPERRWKVNVRSPLERLQLVASHGLIDLPSGDGVTSGSKICSTVQMDSLSLSTVGSSERLSATRSKTRSPPRLAGPLAVVAGVPP